jgi:hypothetical protein
MLMSGTLRDSEVWKAAMEFAVQVWSTLPLIPEERIGQDDPTD